jgi:hypothetical protein
MPIAQPTTMMEFFHKSAGIWFTQRTVHHFDAVEDESGESKLYVTPVAADNERVIEICRSQGMHGAIAAGGAAFMWQEHKEAVGDPDPDQAAILVDVPDDATGRSGKLLRNQGYVERIPVVSRYWFGQDGILTIDTEYDHNQGQERAWFITDDFRVRVSTVRMQNGVYLMTYCSEQRYWASADLDAMVAHNLNRAAIYP